MNNGEQSWKRWFQTNFNVLFLGALFLVVIHWAIHGMYSKLPDSGINYLSGIAGQLLSAILGMMVGANVSPLPRQIPPGTTTATTTATITETPAGPK